MRVKMISLWGTGSVRLRLHSRMFSSVLEGNGQWVYPTGSDDPIIPYVIVTLTHSLRCKALRNDFVGTVFLTPLCLFSCLIVDIIVVADLCDE
jgi:hypothetical protein